MHGAFKLLRAMNLVKAHLDSFFHFCIQEFTASVTEVCSNYFIFFCFLFYFRCILLSGGGRVEQEIHVLSEFFRQLFDKLDMLMGRYQGEISDEVIIVLDKLRVEELNQNLLKHDIIPIMSILHKT